MHQLPFDSSRSAKLVRSLNNFVTGVPGTLRS